MIRMFLFCVASHKNSSQNQSNCGIFDSRLPTKLKIFGLKIILIKIVWHASRSQVFLTFSNSHDLTHERESHEIDCRAKYF